MGPSQNKCHEKGCTTQGHFLPSPLPKSRKNAHLKRSSLKLFLQKNQLLRRILGFCLTIMRKKHGKHVVSGKILFFWPLVMKTCVFGQNGNFFFWCFFVNAKYYGPFLCQKYVFGKFCARSFQRYVTWGVNSLQHELERKNASKILLFIEKRPNKESCVKMLKNGGFLTTQGRLSPPPLPNPAKNVVFGKIGLEKLFFASFSSRGDHNYLLNDQKA